MIKKKSDYMKTLLLILITHSLAFAISTQVVVGSFLYENNAKLIYKSLQKYMTQDSKFYEENSLSANYKKYGKYFIVTLEPIYDNKTLFSTLYKVKPRFQDSYILELSVDDIQTSAGEEIEEPQILHLKQKEDIVIPSVTKENITKLKQHRETKKEEKNMLSEYQNEIIALILILIVSNIYFIIRNPKNKKDKITQEEESIQEIKIDDFDTDEIPKQQNEPVEIKTEVVEELNIENFDGIEEGSFGIEEVPQEKLKAKPVKAAIRKRSVPNHTKITKQHFKEFAGIKILVAEDNLINQKVITGLLADTGIEITLADDGQEALDILETDSDFTIILMDAHMPRVDGFEATRIIRANPDYAHIVVVALSGDTAADDIKKMSDAGMQEHLEKPLRMDALYDIIYAYTGTTQEQNSEEYIHVVATKELNGDKGLEICGGDEEFYNEILTEFVATYENSTNKLSTLLNSGDLVQADKLLLDIIGVTANIGADPLNRVSSTIKEALKDTQEKSYLTLLEQYKEHLEELIVDIKEYV